MPPPTNGCARSCHHAADQIRPGSPQKAPGAAARLGLAPTLPRLGMLVRPRVSPVDGHPRVRGLRHAGLSWEGELFVIPPALDVIVEEVDVDDCLDDARNPHCKAGRRAAPGARGVGSVTRRAGFCVDRMQCLPGSAWIVGCSSGTSSHTAMPPPARGWSHGSSSTLANMKHVMRSRCACASCNPCNKHTRQAGPPQGTRPQGCGARAPPTEVLAVMGLRHKAVDPVEDVQRTVRPVGRNVSSIGAQLSMT